ncbi:MAG: S-methyl-5-thioribose-1-phosphate isomerase [Nitriliruptorales bacterium]|nr:S-methyl-5-thioribose-1-phosphate isomerase [Nitriliruptorales bacterium]
MRVSLDWVDDHLEVIDQTRLPTDLVTLRLETVAAVVEAIQRLRVRGAPALGACGALGLVVGLDEHRPATAEEARALLDGLAQRIGSARPTAVNLGWAARRVRDAAVAGGDTAEIRRLALAEALAIVAEDRQACQLIGEHGARELEHVHRILTHCNTGRLATTGWGTALAVVYTLAAGGAPVEVLATETRPLLQGARLTAWELADAGVPVRLLADGAAASALAAGMVDAVVVGADRIAANGDTANKIGTYGHAVAAQAAGIPFYVAAPLSTVDLGTASGAGIVIEERDADELRAVQGAPTAPPSVEVWNPAFDVTPHALVTALITEAGVLRPPLARTIAAALRGTGNGTARAD